MVRGEDHLRIATTGEQPGLKSACQRLNVLVMSGNYLPHAGGSRIYYHNVYSRFAPDHVTVITTKVPGWREFDRVHSGANYRIIRRFSPLPDLQFRQFPRALLGAASSFLPTITQPVDLIHAGDLFPQGMLAELLWRFRGIPYVAYCHGEEVTVTDHYRFQPKFRDRIYLNAAMVIANSEFARHKLLQIGVADKRILKITPGVDLDRFSPREKNRELISRFGLESSLVLMTVARLVPRKGHDMVLHALAALRREMPNLKYLIVGNGPDRQRLEHLAGELNVARNVVFVSDVSDQQLPEFYALSDVMVLPNRQESDGDVEGFGMAFIEANAVGRPVIGGRSGGAGEAIVEGVTGMLLDDPKNPEELAAALSILLLNPDLRYRMGKAGVARVQQEFSWEEKARAIREISHAIVRRKNSPPK